MHYGCHVLIRDKYLYCCDTMHVCFACMPPCFCILLQDKMCLVHKTKQKMTFGLRMLPCYNDCLVVMLHVYQLLTMCNNLHAHVGSRRVLLYHISLNTLHDGLNIFSSLFNPCVFLAVHSLMSLLACAGAAPALPVTSQRGWKCNS